MSYYQPEGEAGCAVVLAGQDVDFVIDRAGAKAHGV